MRTQLAVVVLALSLSVSLLGSSASLAQAFGGSECSGDGPGPTEGPVWGVTLMGEREQGGYSIAEQCIPLNGGAQGANREGR